MNPLTIISLIALLFPIPPQPVPQHDVPVVEQVVQQQEHGK